MQYPKFTSAECHPISPEYLRLLLLAKHRESNRVLRLSAARRALALANKLKNPLSKKLHQSRIFSALNKLRAV